MHYTFDAVDELCVNTIRTLSMDGVQRANSGHPGAPMGLAPVAYTLFTRFLKHSPESPDWMDRDRFVLSAGHASMLLYSVLHLSGYSLDLDDLKSFRQWGSRTPGHPEHDPAMGVEMTTGPLGQGCATSVGMALAEAHLAAVFNRSDHGVVDHMTWVLCGDGDLMEGVSAEAASLAGHLGLGKLVWIWDDNRITIEGGTELAFTEHVGARFESYGWHVLRVDDANDLEAVARAMDEARGESTRPSLIAVRSHIAFGAPTKQDSAGAHGSPLGEEEIRGAKASYGWPPDRSFHVPEEVRERFADRSAWGAEQYSRWRQAHSGWAANHPELAAELERRSAGSLPEAWTDALPSFEATGRGPATRAASGKVLNAVADALPELVGGSADLAPSCKTTIASSSAITAASPGGRNIHFGVREHGMGAMLNGMSLHGGIRAFGSTFLVFSDYMRPAIRLAALMKQPVIYVFTHDSVWVGEDGPTHQPVEHVAALRSIPGLVVLRPCDANETAAAWAVAISRRSGPTALILSRQGLPVFEGSASGAREGVTRGAWVLSDAPGARPDLVLMASGSEVAVIAEVAADLGARGVAARVVSMPSWELFDEQEPAYRESVLATGVPRLAVEAGVRLGWHSCVGDGGVVIGIDRFGASAPGAEVASQLGLGAETVLAAALDLVSGIKDGGIK